MRSSQSISSPEESKREGPFRSGGTWCNRPQNVCDSASKVVCRRDVSSPERSERKDLSCSSDVKVGSELETSAPTLRTTVASALASGAQSLPSSKRQTLIVCVEGPGGKLYYCSHCASAFTSEELLQKHVGTHSKEKPFKCGVCGASFSRKDNMRAHLHIHTGERPYKCSLCEKSFLHRATLRVHLRVHTGEKPFACKVCGARFSQKCNMKDHFLTHADEKQFSCVLCPASFRRKGDLQRHVRSHRNERPHKCLLCPKSFTRKDTLTNHIQTHEQRQFV